MTERHGALQANQSVFDEIEGILTASEVVHRAPTELPVDVRVAEVLDPGEELAVEAVFPDGGAVPLEALLIDEAGATVDRERLTKQGGGLRRHVRPAAAGRLPGAGRRLRLGPGRGDAGDRRGAGVGPAMTEPSEDAPAARYVGVGIGTYTEKEYPPLPGAPVEVRQIAELLGARGVRTTVAAATTETGLIAELRQVLPPQPEPGEGQLVVLWAGHGDRLPDASLRLVAEDTAKTRCGPADRRVRRLGGGAVGGDAGAADLRYVFFRRRGAAGAGRRGPVVQRAGGPAGQGVAGRAGLGDGLAEGPR